MGAPFQFPEILIRSFSVEDIRRLELLLRASNSPPALDGLVALVANIRTDWDGLRHYADLPRVDRWCRWLDALGNKLRSLPLPPHITTRPDLKPQAVTYRLFFEIPSFVYGGEVVTRIRALRGLALAEAMASRHEIQETLAKHLMTLMRAGEGNRKESSHWRELANALPLEVEAIKQLHTQALPLSIQHFLQELTRLLDARIPDVPDRDVEDSSPSTPVHLPPSADNPMPAAGGMFVDEGDDTGEQPDKTARPGGVKVEAVLKEGFVHWQWIRAHTCSRLEACGLEYGWNFLHRTELRRRTRLLAIQIRQGDARDQRLAALALISLLTGFPPVIALSFSLTPNDDLWIDLDKGMICWCLDQLVARDPQESWIAEAGYSPSPLIRLPLPECLHTRLAELRSGDVTAGKYGALLFPGEDIPTLLTEYESFLRSPDKTSHETFPSRFAYSFGRLLLHLSGAETLATLGSLDFALGPSSQLNYLCIKEDRLHRIIEAAHQYLELGPTTQLSETGWIGSPLRPKDVVVVEGWQKMQQECLRLKKAAAPNCSLATFVDAWNGLARLHLLGAVMLMALRGTRLSRLNYSGLFHAAPIALVSDKEVSEALAYRLVPRYPQLAAHLDNHLANLHALADRFRGNEKKFASRLLSICRGERPYFPVFFTVVLHPKGARIHRLTTADLKTLSQSYFNATSNFGRHFWMSKLTEEGIPRYLLRILFGHSRNEVTPHGVAMAQAPRDACQQLASYMEKVIRDMGLEPLASMRKAAPGIPPPFIPPRLQLGFLGNPVVEDFLSTQRRRGYSPKFLGSVRVN